MRLIIKQPKILQVNLDIANGEAQLVARCKTGEPAAQKEMYARFAKCLLNSSYRIVQNRADAEDLMQDAFVDAFRTIDKYSGTHSFEGWLKRIVINKSISFLRKKKMGHWVDVSTVPMAEEKEEEQDEDDVAISIQQVKDALLTLPAQQQIIFNLFAVDDLSHQEIGNMLNLSAGNVRIIYHRAKNKILERIKNTK